MGKTRVLLVNGNDDLLDAISAWLADRPGIEVVGRAHSAEELIDRLPRLRPDLVLLDARLPDGSGLELTRQIRSLVPRLLVVLLVSQDGRVARAEALGAGAADCIPKSGVRQALLPAIERLLRSRERGGSSTKASPGHGGEGETIANGGRRGPAHSKRRKSP